jgi:hypothetical protein
MRKGRFDEIFFVDLPGAAERSEIFAIHLKKRKRDITKFDLDKLAGATVGFSGAEIEQVVVAALFSTFGADGRDVTTEDIVKAASQTVPLSTTMREGIDELRLWAAQRARPTSSKVVENASPAFAASNLAAIPPPARAPADDRHSPYSMDSEEDELTARIDALERKTATGLDIVRRENQNASSDPAPAVSEPQTEVSAASSHPGIATGADDNRAATVPEEPA